MRVGVIIAMVAAMAANTAQMWRVPGRGDNKEIEMRRNILSGTALALLLATQALGQDAAMTSDPCTEYQVNKQLDSLMADSYGRVCERIGHSRVTPECMTYYIRVTDTGGFIKLSDDGRAALAADCEATQPGGTTLKYAACESGAECLAADVEPMPDDPVAIDPDGTMECGAMQECVEPDGAEEPIDDAHDAGVGDTAPVTAEAEAKTREALDLEFWNAVKDSDDPALLQAYLDGFPDGVFRPIAEARVATLGAAAPVGAQDADPAEDPQALFAKARRIMARAYEGDVSGWDKAGARAIPLFREAGRGGVARAWIELGNLTENGIGTEQDISKAATIYLRAARAGVLEGYVRALAVLDQIEDNSRYVKVFHQYFGAAPGRALARLREGSTAAQGWVQKDLRAKGYYHGAIDGAFGPASKTALEAFTAGLPPPPKPAPVPAENNSLARKIQRQLARVGCYGGAIDGKWGPGTTQAMRNFNHWGGANAPTARASQSGFDAVRAAQAPICGVD